MSRFTKPTINWLELEKLVPKDQKVQFLAFKGRSDNYLRKVNANPPEPPPIDWAYYQKVVPVSGLVEKFKSSYEAFKVPMPEDKYSKEVDAQWSSLQGAIKTYVAERQQDIDSAKKDLARLNALPKFEDMTMETYCEMYPDVALQPVERPSFWPHDAEEQPDYKPPGGAAPH